MPPEEQVLVVERRVFDDLGAFEGVCLDADRYVAGLLAPGVPRFMLRSKAEVDPGFKQIIPYVILTHGDRIVSYVRGKQSGETRLVGRRSIGIGGHINPADDMPLFHTDFREVYRAAVEREVAEEVRVESRHTDRIVALLNDDSTEVGRVHLGVVHYWQLDSPEVRKNEQAISQLAMMTLAELQASRDSLESWSAMCLDHLPKMAERAAAQVA
jgi:predicted NUDIX family phosphoesterase